MSRPGNIGYHINLTFVYSTNFLLLEVLNVQLKARIPMFKAHKSAVTRFTDICQVFNHRCKLHTQNFGTKKINFLIIFQIYLYYICVFNVKRIFFFAFWRILNFFFFSWWYRIVVFIFQIINLRIFFYISATIIKTTNIIFKVQWIAHSCCITASYTIANNVTFGINLIFDRL